ncbi:recombinase family protein [Marinoscillum furvescens]|uniref:recombinase family protein n=1 Tax=Marinoscillum furvescens TaxID=1026 RepID=UPI000E25AF2A
MYLDKSSFEGKRAVCYLRKSTDDAYRQKYSIQAQREQMEMWSSNFGVITEKYFIDDHSAKDFKRPGWVDLMDYLKKHHTSISLVLIIDYSRFSRNDVLAYVSINQLDQWGIELQAIDQLLNYEVPESLIMRGNYITMPAVDNLWRSKKVKRGMIQSLRAGNWCAGKYPRGFWKDKNTGEVQITDEGKLIAAAYDKIAHHGYNIREAQTFLNLRGVNVTFKALSKMLRNVFYKGYISHRLLGSEIVKGNQPPLVDPTTWQLVQDILSGNKKSGKNEDLFPLKKFLQCPDCGKSHTAYQRKTKQKPDGSYREKKSKPIYYKCACGDISGKKLHETFSDMLSSFSLNHNDVDILREELEIVFNSMQEEARESQALLKKRITEQSQFLEKLEKKYINDGLDTETYKKHKESTLNEIHKLESALRSQVQLSNPTQFINNSLKLVTKPSKIWRDSNISAQRELQKLIFPEGLMYSKKKEEYRTPRIHSIFAVIHSPTKEKTRLTNGVNLVYSTTAVPRGIEPLFPG